MALTPAGEVPIANAFTDSDSVIAEVGGNTRRITPLAFAEVVAAQVATVAPFDTITAETEADAIATAADATQTALDRIATGADAAQTASDRAATDASRDTALAAAATLGATPYATKALMDAVTPGTLPASAYVYADATDANNGLYFYPSGGSAWEKDALDVSEQLLATDAVALAASAAVKTKLDKSTADQSLAYLGSGPTWPIAVDKESRALLWYDEATDAVEMVGPADPLGVGSVLYDGGGPIWPLAVDGVGRSLMWFDEALDVVDYVGNTTPATPIALTGSQVTGNKIAHFLYGQSNSTAAGSDTLITTTQPYANVSFNGGAQPGVEISFAESTPSLYTSFIPLVEADKETSVSYMCNQIATLAAKRGEDPIAKALLGAGLAKGGADLAGISKGTAHYNDVLIQGITQMEAIDGTYRLSTIGFSQGESEQIGGVITLATYQATLEQFIADVNTDTKAITGQTEDVYLVAMQTADQSILYSDISRAQLKAAQENPKIFLAAPMYSVDYGTADGLHCSSLGKKQIAAYYARAMDQITQGIEPRWLNPLSAVSQGSEVRVKFDVPVLPLTFDTTNRPTTTDFGFAVEDSVGVMTISDIRAEGDEVVITLSTTPTGATEVRCALDYTNVELQYAARQVGTSNLRDSSPETVTLVGSTFRLYNWAPHFKLPVYEIKES